MKISIGLPPGPELRDLAQAAEGMGFHRVWLFDSPPLWEDTWIHLAQIAEATKRIQLGTAVLVPNLRHVMTTASAIATVDRLAPGRLVCALGTGTTARLAMGKKPLTWKATRKYVEQLKGLLRGDAVTIDGEQCQMMHWPELATARPIEVPILLSAFGPKGTAIAKEIADGYMGVMPPTEPFDVVVQMINGTILDPGELTFSDRVLEATGMWEAMVHHGLYAGQGKAVDNLPGGADWRVAVEAEVPEGQRHLATWRGHATHMTDRDRDALRAMNEASMYPQMVWIGEAEEIRTRAQASEAAGVTDLMYTPGGPDINLEMRRFAEAVL